MMLVHPERMKHGSTIFLATMFYGSTEKSGGEENTEENEQIK